VNRKHQTTDIPCRTNGWNGGWRLNWQGSDYGRRDQWTDAGNAQFRALIGGCEFFNQALMAAAHDQFVMLKGAAIAALVLIIAGQLDQYVSNGRYADVAFAMLRQIRHSFGV
jgi:hypothetical protein